jgi:hypothetical protein
MALMPRHVSQLLRYGEVETTKERRGSWELRRWERRHPDSNRGVEVLQTSALPLGYAACCQMIHGGKVRNIIARL